MPLFEQSVDYKIGARVHTLMWHAKVSQVEMARRFGVTQATISRKLRGERSFSAEELIKVAEMFGVSVAVLFGEKENGPTVEPGRSNESLHTESNRRPFHYNVHSISAHKRKRAGAR